MDYTTEVVNITKIKDGFFLGDEATATNLDVIIQFKITHMINAAGSQIVNAWETIGIKYLTLNWSENPNQNLFDPKDEIVNRIVNFIDETFRNGEGLLIHSLRGQNRGSIVVILYLIKKYRWTLTKSLEFLTNKKTDVDIPKYFLVQLQAYESRLSKIGQGPKSNTWNDMNANDQDEVLVRNTYVNGLQQSKPSRLDRTPNQNKRKIMWADSIGTVGKKGFLAVTNLNKELFTQKDIKPITSHKKLQPLKSCMKTKTETKVPSQMLNKPTDNLVTGATSENERKLLNSNSQLGTKFSTNVQPSGYNPIKTSNDLLMNYSQLGMYSNYPSNNANEKQINEKPKNKIEDNNSRDILRERSNYFMQNNQPGQRSASVGADANKLKDITMKDRNGEVTKIIITSKYENIVNHNINNIIIQSPENINRYDNDLSKVNLNSTNNLNNLMRGAGQLRETGVPSFSSGINLSSSIGRGIIGETNEKGQPSLSKNNSKENIFQSQISSSSTSQKLTKSLENQRNTLQNNFFSTGIPNSNNMIEVIDYNTNTSGNYMQQNSNTLANSTLGRNQIVSYNNYQSLYNNPTNKPQLNSASQFKSSTTATNINNYQPELNRKNNFNSNLNNFGLINRPNSQASNKGPVKVQTEYDRKPSTPDNTINKRSGTSTTKNSMNPSLSSNQHYGTIRRTNSRQRSDSINDRPSTAPEKKEDGGYKSLPKRLPSPSIKPSNILSGSSKNLIPNSLNPGRYRAPSPSLGNKSTSLGTNIKSSGYGKPQWK